MLIFTIHSMVKTNITHVTQAHVDTLTYYYVWKPKRAKIQHVFSAHLAFHRGVYISLIHVCICGHIHKYNQLRWGKNFFDNGDAVESPRGGKAEPRWLMGDVVRQKSGDIQKSIQSKTKWSFKAESDCKKNWCSSMFSVV